MANTTAIDGTNTLDATMRRKSVGQVEINGPDGRRKTVDLSEMNEADRALAEQFGYKPVRLPLP